MAGRHTKSAGRKHTGNTTATMAIILGTTSKATKDIREQGHGFELGSLAWIKGVTLILDQKTSI